MSTVKIMLSMNNINAKYKMVQNWLIKSGWYRLCRKIYNEYYIVYIK